MEHLQRAAQELNALGLEPAIDCNNVNVDQKNLEILIIGRVYSLVSEGFVRNKALAIIVFVEIMKSKLSQETITLLKNLLRNCNMKEEEKNLHFEPGHN
jgi:hypothetical protein